MLAFYHCTGLVYTNFQTEEEFQQWTVVDNNADDSKWGFDPYAEPSHVFYTYHSSNTADDWFISPAITSTVTGTLAVSFSVNGSSYGEKLELFYGSEQTLNAMTNRVSDVIYLNKDEITNHLYLINVNADEPIHLGFHACSDPDTWRLYLCEVKVQFTENPVDIQVTEFVSPIGDFGLGQETVTVKVKNSGNVDIESFDVSFSVDEETIATETVNQALVAGAEMEYTFTAKADLSTPRKLYTIKAWTTHADDVNTTNDACTTEVLHKAPATIPYTMGFEANEYTDGITFFNLNEDDGNWDLYTDPWWSLAHTGDYCLAYNYDKNNNGDDWAILEPITIEEAGYYVLKFWYSGDDIHPEKLAVYYGNEGTPEAMTNKIVEYAPFARSAYEESINIFSIDEPQTIYIGFYAFSDKDENWLCVDDVTFEKVDADAIDIAVLPIEKPLEFVHNGTKKDVNFKVRNLGVQDVTSTINVKIDEETVYEETIEILAQEIKDVVVADALENIAAGTHEINVMVTTDGDEDETNNIQTLSIRVMDTPALAWDFEDGQLPADFTYRVEDEGTVNAWDEFNEYGWGIFNIQEHELYGEYVLAGTSWLDGTEKADRWLILPPFTPTEESFLVWDVASFNPNLLEDYSVMISTNGDDSFCYFTEEEYLAESADFKTRGISLSEYSGQDIYIAFRLRSENCDNLILDNIELYGGTKADLFDVVATVNPEEGIVKKLDTFIVTFENVESVAIEEYPFYPPYITTLDENDEWVKIADAKFETVEGQPTTLSISIDDDSITEITEDGKYALVIPRKDLIFNGDSDLLIKAKEFVFYYAIGVQSTEPQAPTNVTAVATGPNTILLSWNAAEGALYYGINVDGVYAGVVEAATTSFEYGGLNPETTYCFSLFTITEVVDNQITGYSEDSEEACATTEVGILPPANIKAEATSTTVTLSWDAVEGAIGYGVMSNGELVGATNETFVVIDELKPSTEYCFTLISISEVDDAGYIVGFSKESDEVCVTTESGVGVDEFTTTFNIYPNPVNDMLFVESDMNVEEVSIYNVNGQLATVNRQQVSSTEIAIDVEDLTSGVYFIKIKTENGETVKRFIKK